MTILENWRRFGHYFQNLFFILMVVVLGCRFLIRVYYGACVTNSLGELLYCNHNAEEEGFPEDSIITLAFTPVIYPILLRDTDWTVVLITWIISIIFLFVGTAINYRHNPLMFILIGVIALYTGIAIYGNQLQNPLASFVSGLDMVADIAQDGLHKLSKIENYSSEEMVLYDGSHYKHLAKERVGEIGPGSVCQLPGSLRQSSCRDSDESAKASVASGMISPFANENIGGRPFDAIRRTREITVISSLAADSNRSNSMVSRVDENSNLHLTSPRDLAEQPSIANMSTSASQALDVPALNSFSRSSSGQERSLRVETNGVGGVGGGVRTNSFHRRPSSVQEIHQFIIGVSANSDTDTMNEAFTAGVDAFISKPFSIDVFYQTYNQHCRGLKFRLGAKP
eukprot:gene827-898_t